MTSIYTPDSWQVIHVNPQDKAKSYYRVLAGWSGSYMYGSSWKVSSGFEQVFDMGTHWKVTQRSGSVYLLYKNSEKASMATAGVLKGLREVIPSIGLYIVPMGTILSEFGIHS